YLYDSGAFCTTFHAGLAGWKACLICKKYLHCGCIVSEKDIFVMNFGGVCCLVCAKKYLLPAEDETDEDKPVNDCPPLLTWNNSSANQSMDRPSNETKTGDGCFSRRNSTMAAPNESTHQMVISGAQCKQKNAVLGGGSSSTAMYNASSSLSENNGTQPNHSGSCLYVSPQTGLIRFLNFGQMKEQQYLKDLGFLNSTMTPMFKKVLSATDTKVKSGRLVIPTKGARAYLPELEDKQRCILLEILDTKGNIWKLSYRFWENNRGRIYVLGGLKAYITIWKWQVGDQVTFYRIEPENKYLIVTEKELPVSEKKLPASSS
ncbi:hypothetical protein HN51_043968, partial [Arachis hypogaea]